MARVLGKDHIKKEMALKITGKATYVGDIDLPGMLECKVLKSPYAHARILSIDTTEAENLPGVRAVVTHKDSDILRSQPFKTALPFETGPHNDFYALPPEAVYMAGEQVAAVAAETKEIAQEAIKLIKVEYEPLAAIFDPLEAIKPGAPVIYPDRPDNKAPMFNTTTTRGDLVEGFKDADVILESRYRWPTTAHCPLEPYQAVARWDEDKLTVWISTQAIWQVQDYVSWALKIPTNKISVIAKWVGGGFGGKATISHIALACITAALAKKAGRPVRSLLEMDEQFIMSPHNCGPGYYDVKGGIKLGDGRPVASDTVMYVSAGGHPCNTAANVVREAGINVYKWDNVQTIANPVICNLNMSGPKRSYGDAEGMFCSEQFADELAEAAGMDPLEWRQKWVMRPGDPCCCLFQWGELAGGNYAALMAKTAEAFGWKEKWRGWKTPTAVNGAKRRGIGMALGMKMTGIGTSGSLVRINHDGTVNVNCAAEDIGQGIKSATAICVAEVLGVRYEDVSVTEDNTAYNPRGGGVYASKGTPTNIGASINAARNAKVVLLERAAALMVTKPEELDVKDGKVFIKNQPTKGMTIGDIAGAAQFGGVGIYAHGQETSGRRNPDTGQYMWEKSLSALCCEVEVDTETGKVEVLKIVMAGDCGVVINPEAALGQIDGGIIQGLGIAIYEDLIFDKHHEGIIINPNLTDYKIPTFPEFADFTSIIHSDPADAPTTQLNAKGMGESTTVPVGPAIANAIYNATGARVRVGPLTPERVLTALGKI
jgi:xanthine dehydrogenase molybdenum-binding subunit